MLQNNFNLHLKNGIVTETMTYSHLKQDCSVVEVPQTNKDNVLQINSNISVEDNGETEVPTADELVCNVEEQTLHSKSTVCGGLLLVWGCGEFGQHGHGHTEDVLSADALGSPLWLGQDRMVLEVACGSSHTLVLTGQQSIQSYTCQLFLSQMREIFVSS